MYRYRLADIKGAPSLTSCVIEGIRLRKSTWYNSSTRIDFKAFMSMIIEESAESLQEFDQRDLGLEDIPETSEEAHLPDLSSDAGRIERPVSVVEKIPDRLSSVAAQLRGRGFSSREIAGRSDAELKELLAFDMTISGRRK